MSKLYEELRTILLPGMVMPEPFKQLFDWIERNGYIIDTEAGRIGTLFPDDELKAGRFRSG